MPVDGLCVPVSPASNNPDAIFLRSNVRGVSCQLSKGNTLLSTPQLGMCSIVSREEDSSSLGHPPPPKPPESLILKSAVRSLWYCILPPTKIDIFKVPSFIDENQADRVKRT